jgi:hypothetical protein
MNRHLGARRNHVLTTPPPYGFRLSRVQLVVMAMALLASAAGATEFAQLDAPSPADESYCLAIAAGPNGHLLVGSYNRIYGIGGSDWLPLLMERLGPAGPWVTHTPPAFGDTYHEIDVLEYLPGTDGDFVAVGGWYPDPDLAYQDGFVLRYHRNSGTWDLHVFDVPAADFLFVIGATLDPGDPDRLLVCGTWGNADEAGFCFQFHAMVIDYRLDTHTYALLPTTELGSLADLVALDDRIIGFGLEAVDCDYGDAPLVLEFAPDGSSRRIANPAGWPGHPVYTATGATLLRDGRVFVVGGAS